MKKIIFTLPALLLVLSACNNTSISSESADPSQGESQFISEKGSESSPTSEISESESSFVSEEISQSESESIEISSTAGIEETEVSFANIKENGGYRYSDNVTAFESYFPSGLLASTPTISNIYAQHTGDESDVRLTIGTGSYDGEIILSLVNPINSLFIEGCDYYKTFSYGTTSGITYGNAKITVNSHYFEFTHVENEGDIPELETFEIRFEEPTSTLAISNELASGSSASSGRAFINSLTFVTYL